MDIDLSQLSDHWTLWVAPLPQRVADGPSSEGRCRTSKVISVTLPAAAKYTGRNSLGTLGRLEAEDWAGWQGVGGFWEGFGGSD